MNIYEVGYHSFEESPTHILVHENLYSETEFQNIVAEVMANVAMNIDKLDMYMPQKSPMYLLDKTIDILINEHGFVKPEIKGKFIPYGWSSIETIDMTSNAQYDEAFILLHKKFINLNRKNQK